MKDSQTKSVALESTGENSMFSMWAKLSLKFKNNVSRSLSYARS